MLKQTHKRRALIKLGRRRKRFTKEQKDRIVTVLRDYPDVPIYAIAIRFGCRKEAIIELNRRLGLRRT
jgi:hypothetical protein